MTLVNLTTETELHGYGAEVVDEHLDVVVLDVHLRRVEVFAALREVASCEDSGGRAALMGTRTLAARIDELRRAAFSEYLETRMEDMTRTGDALGML